MKHFFGALLAFSAFTWVEPAWAQVEPAARPEIFKPEVRTVARRIDSASDIRTRRDSGRRVDVRTGITRAVYGAGEIPPGQRSVESAARDVVKLYEDEFGLRDSGDLVVESVRTTNASHHVLFRQVVGGVPVYRRTLKVNLDAELEPTIVLNSIDPGIARRAPDLKPVIPATAARDVALATISKGGARLSDAHLEIFPTDPPRLVWRMLMWPEEAPGEWDVLVDAHTGEVVQLLDQASHEADLPTSARYRRSGPSTPLAVSLSTGSGYVFDPDPLTSSGAPYGSPYIDGSDADATALNDERILVDLLEISLGSDGKYRLDGPHVKIVGGGSLNPPYDPPAVADAGNFTFTRGDDHFEAVNAYYHIDKSQRYVQSLGFVDRQNGPLSVNPRAFASDNSFYTPSQNIIEFGIGGVDDAEDAGVLWHEYGHALLEAGAPGLNAGEEGQALHEGWSDFWAGSYMRFLAETQTGKRSDWENVFRWDSGDGQIWPGRSLTATGTYPDDTTCDDPGDPNGDGCRIYSDGLLWATTLMDLYTDLGKSVIDRLVIQSHSYLAHPVTFTDAGEAVLQADRDLFGGVHTAAIVDRLSAHGYLGVVGPIVSHTPLPASEQLGGTVRVEVEALQGNAPVQSVTLFHRKAGSGSFTEQILALESGALYSTSLALPSNPATVEYYILAVDQNLTQTRLPASPNDYYAFTVGPDTEPPTIAHIPVPLASAALWPAEIVAFVDDNLGVDTVWVTFSIEDVSGTPYDSGSFGLSFSGTGYRGVFTTDVSLLQPGSTVRYSVNARDAAMAGNTTRDPIAGEHHFPVVFSGLLQQWDLEVTDGNFQATGAWAYGSPEFTLRTARSGEKVWGTNLTGSYPDVQGVSYLELPPVNLEGLDSAYLIFWHWYDLEYRGTAEPGRLVQGTFWDGGNVKVSFEGGSFSLVEPEGGYPWFIDAGGSNPLGGESAFGAYSFGWRQEVIPLPTRRDVRIRFELGTDDSNLEQSVAYTGWYLDDLSVSTERPTDTTPPVIVAGPPDIKIQPVGLPMPAFSLATTDDTGISSVFVDYQYGGDGGTSGSFPLAMTFDDLTSFEGVIPAEPSLSAGGRFEYRFRVTDFAGNEIIFPAVERSPLIVEYRTVRTVDVLVDIVPTGYWVQEGSVWVTRPKTEMAPVSSLVLPPSRLPSNASDVYLSLQHSFVLREGLGGNVSYSVDDGRTWAVLPAVEGYPARFSSPSHPMNGLDVFAGDSTGLVTTLFDLSSNAGREVRFRFDFASSRLPGPTERWSISAAAVQASSVESEIEIPVELSLNANFPDPFSSTTTISYSVPERSVARIDVYNVLGQLMAVLTNRVHEAGTYTLTYDGSGLSSGVYFLTLDVSGVRKVERMIVAH